MRAGSKAQLIFAISLLSIIANAFVIFSYLFDAYYLSIDKTKKKIFPRFVANLCASNFLVAVCFSVGHPSEESVLCRIQGFIVGNAYYNIIYCLLK